MALHPFLKLAGVKTEKEFYSKFSTPQAFFDKFPEAQNGYTMPAASTDYMQYANGQYQPGPTFPRPYNDIQPISTQTQAPVNQVPPIGQARTTPPAQGAPSSSAMSGVGSGIVQVAQTASDIVNGIGAVQRGIAVAAPQILNSLIPEEYNERVQTPQIGYNPYAYGTGSQAMYQNGGEIRPSTAVANLAMRTAIPYPLPTYEVPATYTATPQQQEALKRYSTDSKVNKTVLDLYAKPQDKYTQKDFDAISEATEGYLQAERNKDSVNAYTLFNPSFQNGGTITDTQRQQAVRSYAAGRMSYEDYMNYISGASTAQTPNPQAREQALNTFIPYQAPAVQPAQNFQQTYSNQGDIANWAGNQPATPFTTSYLDSGNRVVSGPNYSGQSWSPVQHPPSNLPGEHDPYGPAYIPMESGQIRINTNNTATTFENGGQLAFKAGDTVELSTADVARLRSLGYEIDLI